jgi:nitronate monooxygenase
MSVLANEFTSRWHDHQADLDEHLPEAITQYRQAVADRDYTIANVTVGQAVGLIDSTRPAAELVTCLIDEARAAIDAWCSHRRGD